MVIRRIRARELTRYLASTDERLSVLGVNLALTNELRAKLIEAARRD